MMTTRASHANWIEHRNRLAARLDLGLSCKLTLVTAPEGYGKTTLLAQWAGGAPVIVALIDLEHETDPATLIERMAATLHEMLPTYVSTAASGDVPCEELLVDLINSVAAFPQDVAIVIDNYQSAPQIDECLGFLLEYLPPQLHLYIAGESMPSVSSLPRLRVRRQLVELTAGDLELTVPEVDAMISYCLDCTVDDEAVARLVAVTRGCVGDVCALIEKVRAAEDPLTRLKSLLNGNGSTPPSPSP